MRRLRRFAAPQTEPPRKRARAVPPALEEEVERRGGTGTALPPAVRQDLEHGLGAPLGTVALHTDEGAARLAKGLDARAFTVGSDVFFGHKAYDPDSTSGFRLLAHEMAHVLQGSPSPAKAPLTVSEPTDQEEREAEWAADRATERHVSGTPLGPQRAGTLPAGDGQLLEAATRPPPGPSRAVSDHGDPAERGARLVASGGSASIGATPTAHIHRQEAPTPARSPELLGMELQSDVADTRAFALTELAAQTGPAAWSAMLRAQLSRHPDVRAGADKAFRSWATQPGFMAFLKQEANTPRGMTSDLALLLLESLGKPGPTDPENYRNVIRQRLDLAYGWVNGLAKDFEEARQRIQPDYTKASPVSPVGAPFAASALVTEIEALQKDLPDADADALARLGVRSSLLIERLSLIRITIAGLKEQSAQLKQPGAMKEFIDTRLVTLLSSTGKITSETEDKASREVAEQISRWPADLTYMIADQLHGQFTDAREQIAGALKDRPLPSFKKAWQNFRTTVLEPILPEVDHLISQAASIRTLAPTDTERALTEVQNLRPLIEEVGSRVQAAVAAIEMESTYKDLALTNEPAKDLHGDTEWNMKQFFAAFAMLSADRSMTAEQRQQALEQLVARPEFKQMQKDVADWHEILAGEMRFALLLAEIGILVISAYTGGIAGGIVRGLLGRGVSLAGRLAIGAAVVGAEATAFTVTSRLLHMPLGAKFYDDKFFGELGLNALLFGVLRGSGAVYEKFVSPHLPKAMVGVGKATLTFSLFQAWTVGLHAWEKGEWIGLGDARFWKMAAQNVLLLGALHIGMAITRPLMAPVAQKMFALTIERHNARCAALGRSIEGWKTAEKPSEKDALDIVRRSRALYLERLEIMRELHKGNPAEFTAEELKQAEAVLRSQVAAADELLFQGRARMVAHETDPNTFYYEGDADAIRKHYESKGYKTIEHDPQTGRLRLTDPAGKEIDLIRSTFGTTGAGRRPTALEAEKIYDVIRRTKGDTAAISNNTGIPDGVLRIIRQHVFFKKHLIFDPTQGKQARRTFTADEDIAQLWTAATRGKLNPEDLALFRRVMAHEYVEAMLVRGGMEYQDPRAWVQEPDGTWTYRPSPEHFGAHDLAPRTDPNVQAFGHYEALKIPLKNVARLPLKAWMGIPPEDLIYIDNPRLTTALAQLTNTLGTDLTRKLIVVAAAGGADPALTGTLERLAKLPAAEAAKQAEALVALLGAKPKAPAVAERGAPFKRGGTAQLYGMKDRPDLLVKPAGGRLSREAQALVDLESLAIPTPYIATKMVEGTPSIILEKIDGESSKDIIGRVSNLRPLRDAQHVDIVTPKTIDDLDRIYAILVVNRVNIGDFQFIVRRSDGRVFVNDPTGLTFNSEPSTKIQMIIDRFVAILKMKEGSKP